MTFRAACRATSVWRTWAGALPFAGVFFTSSSGLAIPVPVPIQDRIFFESTVFTSGSVVVGRLDCSTELCSPEALRFVDGSDVTLNGELVDVSATLGSAYFGWLSDVPLVPGTYRVDLKTETLAGIAQFQIVEASTALPTATVLLNNYATVTGERVDCVELASTAVEQGFYEQALYQVAAVGSVHGENANQYIYDMRLMGDETNRFTGRSLSRVAEGEPTEVCFAIFARPVVAGEDVSLAAECLSTEGLSLGVVEEINSGMTSALKLCTVPPEGYFQHWCAAFAEQFAARSCVGTHPEACFAARQDCPDGDHPPDEEVEPVLNGTGGTETGGDQNTATVATSSGGQDLGGGSGPGLSEGDSSAPGSSAGSEVGASSGSEVGTSSDTGGCSVSPIIPRSYGRDWVIGGWGVGMLTAFRRRTCSPKRRT